MADDQADPAEDEELAGFRAELLRTRPRPLRPEEGDLAFDQHVWLASLLHRVVCMLPRQLVAAACTGPGVDA